MRITKVVAFLGFFAVVSSVRAADQVHADEVEGSVLYGEGQAAPSVPVKAGEDFNPGRFEANNGGKLYLRVFDRSTLRLDETGQLTFAGFKPSPVRPNLRDAVFTLEQGKLTVVAPGPAGPGDGGYLITIKRGKIDVDSATAVICVHGDGAYIYVARGEARLFSLTGPGADQPMFLSAKGSVGVLEANGTIRIRPLNTVSPGTQNCLLSDLKHDGAGGGDGAPNPANLNGQPPVSPSQ